MSKDVVFSQSNKLKVCAVTINDIELLQDMIIHMEFSYKNETPVILGNMLFNDLYDMNLQIDWSTAVINVLYMDIFKETTEKTFKVLEIQEKEHSNYRKAFDLKLQDVFSYTLEHSYLSKGFNGKISDALTSYLKQLSIYEDYTFDFTDTTETLNFIVPKNQNNLEYFLDAFKHCGYTFYQKRNSICLKSLDDLIVDELLVEPDLYTNSTDNQKYMNRILESSVIGMNRILVGPKIRSLAYDFKTRSMIYDNDNDASNYSLNDDDTSVIDDYSGYLDVCQQHTNFNEHTLNFKNSIYKQNTIEMLTNGYHKNEVNQVYNLILRGNVITADGNTKGNSVVSGKYICPKVVDKIIGSTLIQKISLERSDANSK